MIPLFKVYIAPTAIDEVKKTFDSGFIGQGKKVVELENMLNSTWHTNNVLAVNSGTSALHLAYILIGLKRGDEVISTPITCLATNSPLLNLHCKIKWADVNPVTGLIDPESVEKKITKNTKAIVGVDWGGTPCDYEKLKHFNLPVVQDAAHSFLTKYKTKYVANTGGDYVAYSLQAIKSLTAGEMGILKTPASCYERAKLLRWYGFNRDASESFRCNQDVKEIGFKMNANDINASIALSNIEGAVSHVMLHQFFARYYTDNIHNPKIRVIPYCQGSSYWLYTLHTDQRKELIEHLTKNGIASSLVHNRNDNYTVMKDFKDNNLPGVEEFQRTHLCIPCGWWLYKDDINKIIYTLNTF